MGLNADIQWSPRAIAGGCAPLPGTSRRGDAACDGIVNDRRRGVGLRSLRGDAQFTMNARLTYAILGGGAGGSPAASSRRLSLFSNITNVTSHRNYGGYSGVITSEFYRQPTFVQNPRRVEAGLNFAF